MALVAAGVEHHGALIGRHGAQIAKGIAHDCLAIRWKARPTARGVVDLCAILRSQVLKRFSAGKAALAELVGHLIDLMELLHEPLLIALGQPIKVGI